eukprot:comp22594_c0_seq1/m.34623 comp22594_c0_seq1/g.34623  ORF comp22594_c0_seq1/g.34623 comp22594_c0_seq1/m.34623 type:complete len:868 (-) comp22594_c0_seq1:549-3152(-)
MGRSTTILNPAVLVTLLLVSPFAPVFCTPVKPTPNPNTTLPTPKPGNVTEESSTNDPCLNARRILLENKQNGISFNASRLNDTIPCIKAIPPPPKDIRTFNIEQLYRFLEGFYGWESIVQNSSYTPGFLREINLRNKTWAVHNSTVNWREGLEKINETEWESGFDYHHAIAKLFFSFNDAHTSYQVPALFFTITMPFRVESRMVDGKQVLVLNHNIITNAYNDAKAGWQKIVPEEHFGRPIESINGQGPIEFFQTHFADPLGQYKSPGARFNSFLTTSIMWEIRLQMTGIFNFTDLTFNFGNGSTLTTDILVMPRYQSVEAYYEDMNNPSELASNFYKFVLEWSNSTDQASNNGTFSLEKIREIFKDSLKEDAREPTTVSARAENFTSTGQNSTVDSNLSLFEVLKNRTARFLEGFENSTKGPFDHVVAVLYPREEDPKISDPIGVVFNISGVPVFKLPSFRFPDARQRAAVMETIREIGDRFERSDRLVIDVVGNGGGVVAIMYEMLAALAPGFKNHSELCQSYQLPMSKFGQEWVESYNAFNIYANYNNESEIDEYISVLSKAIEYFHYINDTTAKEMDTMFNKTFLDTDFAEKTVDEKNKIITAFRKSLNATLNAPDPDDLSLTGGRALTPIGYDPFSANDGKEPMTQKPLGPNFLDTYATVEWGGINKTFSNKFLFWQCTFVNISETGEKFPKSFKELVVLTDGTCGSACSTFTSQLAASGLATLVSVGGRKGEPLDFASFNGGYMEDWDGIFKQYTKGIATASILEDYHRIKLQEDVLPLLDSSSFGFDFAVASTNFLPPNTLPVEWYNKPADYHMDVWPAYMSLPAMYDWKRLDPEQYKEWQDIYAHLATSKIDDLGAYTS